MEAVHPYGELLLRAASELRDGRSAERLAWLAAGVGWQESSWGRAPGHVGDGPACRSADGHRHGLMQIDDRLHPLLLELRLPSGAPSWADPLGNIRMGVAILDDALWTFSGDELAAVASFNAGIPRVIQALEVGLDADVATRPRGYASQVLGWVAREQQPSLPPHLAAGAAPPELRP